MVGGVQGEDRGEGGCIPHHPRCSCSTVAVGWVWVRCRGSRDRRLLDRVRAGWATRGMEETDGGTRV